MMASGPQRRRRGARIGAAVAIAVAVAVALGLFRGERDHGETPVVESSFSTIRADGKLVLRVLAPRLY